MPSSDNRHLKWLHPTLTLAGIILWFWTRPVHWPLLLVLLVTQVNFIRVHRHDLFGYLSRWPANLMTSARSLLVLSIPLMLDLLSPEWLTGLYLLAAAADGADGWLARTCQGESAAGATFDVEADSIFLISLIIVMISLRSIGEWMLIPVFVRETWELIKYLLTSPAAPIKFKYAQWVAGISFALLPFGIILSDPFLHLLVISIVTGITLSFFIEIIFYFKKYTNPAND